ncbi:XkdF-like putative serine protease domain-containing protein [Pseudomonas sp. KCJK9000]|uniref:XkdF-like putative serine protease domain-containing protein n=1 Tax=Pseudomonas sp. KCJK9000 TaxID=3344566 RepID=UPI00390620F5
MDSYQYQAEIAKFDEAEGVVYGFVTVYEEAGELVWDRQNDAIDETEVRKMAHRYVSEARVAKVMHGGQPVGEVVESIVLTRDIQKALGIDLGKAGWFIGMKLHDEGIKARVRNGSLAAFSIGGKGIRRDYEEQQ